MAVAIVQSAADTSVATNTDPCTPVLGVSPTTGNLMPSGLGYFVAGAGPPITPSGWTVINNPENGDVGLVTYYRVVQGGDGTSWPFATTGDDIGAAAMAELSGQAAVGFIDQQSTASNSGTTHTTATVTPSVIGCQALAFMSPDAGTGVGGGADGATVSAGWTIIQRPYPDYHPVYLAKRDALTTDTVTGISVTFSNIHNVDNTSSIILIAPAASTTTIKDIIGVGVVPFAR